MNPQDLAVVAMAVVAVTTIVVNHRFHMKVADRVRVVNPPKDKPAVQQQPPHADSDRPISILGGSSSGEAA